MRRYALLFVALTVIGLGLNAWFRRARLEAPPPARTAQAGGIDVALIITPDSRIEPAEVAVAKDTRVRLTVTNHHRLAVSLALMGYQDRFAVAYLPPDSVWRGEFLADRPGEDFAWMLEGAPVGRLRVTGGHLVEGHR